MAKILACDKCGKPATSQYQKGWTRHDIVHEDGDFFFDDFEIIHTTVVINRCEKCAKETEQMIDHDHDE